MVFMHLLTGCGRLWVTDGIWKIVFPICMFRVEVLITRLNIFLLYSMICFRFIANRKKPTDQLA